MYFSIEKHIKNRVGSYKRNELKERTLQYGLIAQMVRAHA